MDLITILTALQVVGDIILIGLILMQSKGTGLGSTFGGGGMFYRSKRGVEKIMYRATIGVAIFIGVVSVALVFFAKSA